MIDPPHRSSNTANASLRARLHDLEKLLLSDAVTTEKIASILVIDARQVGDWYVTGMALCLQAGAAFYQNRFEDTEAIYNDILKTAELVNIPAVSARVLNGLGSLHKRKREYSKSIQYFYSSAKKSNEIHDTKGSQRAMNSIGLTYAALGNHREARDIHLELVEKNKDNLQSDQYWIALINLMHDYVDMGDHESSLEACQKYFLPYRANHVIPEHCLVILDMHYACALANTESSQKAYNLGKSIINRLKCIEDWDALCIMLSGQGKAAQSLGFFEEAFSLFHEALKIAEKNECLREILMIHAHMSEWYLKLEMYQESNQHLKIALEMENKIYSSARWHSIQLHELYEQLNTLESEKAKHDADALHDSLTGLPNRIYFQRTVTEKITINPNASLLVIFVDLDNFKHVNDYYGHDYGDDLLVQVAERLQNAIRPNDMAARLGGDEFTLLIDGMSSSETAIQCANRLLEIVSEPYFIKDSELKITASVGLAMAPQDGQDVATLQKNADEAMYEAKRGGKNSVGVFSASNSSKSNGQYN